MPAVLHRLGCPAPLLSLILPLAHLQLLLQPTWAALNPADRNSAFVGYSEHAQGRAAEEPPRCPPDNRAECPEWAAQGECLFNPVYMRATCKASCQVTPRCTRSMMSRAGAQAAEVAQPWAGHATAAGTASWAAAAVEQEAAAAGIFRDHAVHYSGVDSPAGTLRLSSLGMGTYLGDADPATDEAVTAAVIKTVAVHRWNVVDTAANYRWGRAEVAVGRALQALRTLGGARRDQLFISTKAGFPPEGLLERLLLEGAISRTDVADGVHSMHPTFLATSLNHSLASLGLAAVDLLYIHNPAEMQLQAVGRQAFMQRLQAAFQFCEEARAAGRIKAYGIATWSCFRVPPNDPQHLSLQSVVQLAEHVGGAGHGFRYVQLPVSAGMPESWAEAWQELTQGGKTEHVTVMQAAQQLGIGVFGSGPLMEAGLLRNQRLAQAAAAATHLGAIQGTAPRLLQLARSTPGLLASLVGHKTPAHLDANGALSQVLPLTRQEFEASFHALQS